MTLKLQRIQRIWSAFFAILLTMSSLQSPATAQRNQSTAVIAQTPNLAPIAGIGFNARKKKRSLITDSLWGNLILEAAYDNDPLLSKYTAGIKMMNLAKSFSIAAIAGGTLFQGCYILGAINPPDGHQDSYVPGITGIALSSCTLVTILAQQLVGHGLFSKIRKQQMVLKDRVEVLLTRLESSHCSDAGATKELAELIGDQAATEWLQMWRGTHKLASLDRHISYVQQESTQRTEVCK